MRGNSISAKTNKYEKPTEALHGAVKMEKPIDEPKRLAREHLRKKLLKDSQLPIFLAQVKAAKSFA